MAFGGAVKLTGESEYRKALQNITGDLKKMSKELKGQASDFVENSKDIDKATTAQEELQKTIKSQETVLQKAKGTLAQYNVELQAQTTRHNALTKEYKNAITELDKIQKESGDTSEAYKEQSKIVEKLAAELADSTQSMDESKAAMSDLKSEIRNSEKIIRNAKDRLKDFADEMNNTSNESKQTKSALESLKSTIEEQENKLTSLKDKYKDVVLEQGKNSKESKSLAGEISKLSKELAQNKDKLSDVDKKANDLDKSLREAGNGAENATDGFTVMKAVLADLASNAIQSCIDGLKEFANDTSNSYSKFQAQTGASAAEMEKFREVINDLYKDNFGESLEDIGDKMAYIKQVTGETDPTKLGELAKNAMTLEDTFGSDFKETVRGVQNLMHHFGITSEEAFDLFAKGSQNGLDYTSELGDNIAEYGGNFKQAGYSADEYFQLLENGAKGGAYNLDKVNDSINEVKNRLGDGTIENNIDSFGESTKNYYKEWENGNASMKDVINSIVNDISNCTNEQEALTMAQIAFGTMGEDANLDVVKSLNTLGNSYTDVTGSMEDMKKVRYDNVTSQFESLGRTVKMDLLVPMAEKVLPIMQKFVNYCINNMDKVKTVIIAVGTALTAVFAVNKISQFATSISNLIGIFGKMKNAIAGVEGATKLLNLAWLTNPITLAVAGVVAGVAALCGVMANLRQKQEEAMQAEYGLSEAQKETVKTCEELNNKYNEMNNARQEAVNSINAEYGHISELKNEYNTLIDENGKVKAGYEDRANFIITTLSKSLGVERSDIEKNIDAYGKLGGEIDNIIEKKKAEVMLNANEAAYKEAIDQRTEALNKLQEAQNVVTEAQRKYEESQRELSKVTKEHGHSTRYYCAEMENAKKATEVAKQALDDATKGVENAENAYIGYNTTVQNYEGLSSAILTNDSNKISSALLNMENNFITAEIGTKGSLERQLENLKNNLSSMEQAIKDGTPGVTQQMVDQARTMVDKATEELDKFQSKANESTTKAGQAAVDGVKNGSAGMSGAGAEAGKFFADGVASQNNNSKISGKWLADNARSGAESVNATQAGKNFADGFGGGIKSKSSSIWGIAADMANDALSAIKRTLGIASPSKEAAKFGRFFSEGFAIGVKDKSNLAVKATANIAKDVLNELSGLVSETIQLGSESTQSFADGLNYSTNNLQSQLRTVNIPKANNIDENNAVSDKGLDQSLIISAFKEALSQMKIELDDEEVGSFIDKTVTRAIYN